MTLVFYLPPRPKWHGDALCAEIDTEVFFPEKGSSAKPAKKICGMCVVRTECLTDALANGERFGIFGGLSERERQRIRGGAATSEAAAA